MVSICRLMNVLTHKSILRGATFALESNKLWQLAINIDKLVEA